MEHPEFYGDVIYKFRKNNGHIYFLTCQSLKVPDKIKDEISKNVFLIVNRMVSRNNLNKHYNCLNR